MSKTIVEMLDIIRNLENADAITLIAKLFEEGGELAEATLADAGYLKHKGPLTERAMGECADVFIVTLGVMAKLKQHENLTSQEVADLFAAQITKKFTKYENIMIDYNP